MVRLSCSSTAPLQDSAPVARRLEIDQGPFGGVENRQRAAVTIAANLRGANERPIGCLAASTPMSAPGRLAKFIRGVTQLPQSHDVRFARAAAYIVTNVYATKMAAVFMISTSTVVIYTGIAPRWIAFIGYLLASVLLIGSYYIGWSFAVLPVWVLLISVYILVDNLRERKGA
jgi:hypothetical protein